MRKISVTRLATSRVAFAFAFAALIGAAPCGFAQQGAPVEIEPSTAAPVPVEPDEPAPAPAAPVELAPPPAAPVPAAPVETAPAPAAPAELAPDPAEPVPAAPVETAPAPAAPAELAPDPAEPVPAAPVERVPAPAAPAELAPTPVAPPPQARPDPPTPDPPTPVPPTPVPSTPGAAVGPAPGPLKGVVKALRRGPLLIHGNYCGIGNRPGAPPIDALDEACMRHDACTKTGKLPSCACDDRLRIEATSVAQDPRTPPDVKPVALATVTAMKLLVCKVAPRE